MNPSINSIYYSPVKSLSFTNLNKTLIKKNNGILNDRIFSFSRNINFEDSKIIEKFPKKRKLNNFLTLKNSPVLNKYNFTYDEKKLILFKDFKEIISIPSEDRNYYKLLSDTLIKLEDSLLEPVFLLKNIIHPFFDTTHSNFVSNTISLININSIKDLEKNINQNIEFERFRGNIYIDGLNCWEERNWINKVIMINYVPFKVEKHITRCSATNLKPNTSNVTINLPMALKKHYNHIDMGVYITPLDDGLIKSGDKVILNENFF